MFQIFDVLRARFAGRVPIAPSPPGFQPTLPAEDAAVPQTVLVIVGESVNGMTVIIDYRDAKGAASTRQVSCVRIENSGGKRYLRAFCHHRRAQRMFLVERIQAVIDAETGEVLAAGHEYFGQFDDNVITTSRPGWGLSPKKRADLGAGLTALVFLSRCDGQAHPSETEEVETFAAAWWMRSEIRADMPEQDIGDHARKLAPDVEGFVVAAQRIREDEVLRQLVAGYARRVIEADGRLAPEELHWVPRLINWIEGDDAG